MSKEKTMGEQMAEDLVKAICVRKIINLYDVDVEDALYIYDQAILEITNEAL